MTFIILFIFLALVAGSGLTVARGRSKYLSEYGYPKRELSHMSWAAKELIKEYNSLPAGNRPYANIRQIAEALDIKHEAGKVNNHFSRWGGEHTYSTWNCDCRSIWKGVDNCPYLEYSKLHKSFEEIHEAEKDRQHAFALANVQDGLSQVEELMKSLREERDLMNAVTKEITS